MKKRKGLWICIATIAATFALFAFSGCNLTGNDSGSDSDIEQDLGVGDIYDDGYNAPAN